MKLNDPTSKLNTEVKSSPDCRSSLIHVPAASMSIIIEAAKVISVCRCLELLNRLPSYIFKRLVCSKTMKRCAHG